MIGCPAHALAVEPFSLSALFRTSLTSILSYSRADSPVVPHLPHLSTYNCDQRCFLYTTDTVAAAAAAAPC